MKKILLAVVLSLSILMNIVTLYVIISKNPMKLQGEKSWVDLYSSDSDATVKFLNENLGIKVVATSNEGGMDYRVIKSESGMFPYAGVMQISEEYKKQGLVPHATIYLTVKDYDKMHKQFLEKGAKAVIENKVIENMKFGIYVIPGGLDIGIIQYL